MGGSKWGKRPPSHHSIEDSHLEHSRRTAIETSVRLARISIDVAAHDEDGGAAMTDRKFEAEFQDLVTAFNTARRQVIEGEAADTPDARAWAEAAKQQWRVMKQRIMDLLEDWDDVDGSSNAA